MAVIAPSPAHTLGAREEQARIALANRLLVEHPPFAPEHERGLQLLHAAATGACAAEAQWLLGAYFLQVSSRQHSHAQAIEWLTRAAAEGVMPAMDRLADLALSGLGGTYAPADALQLQRRLADLGHPPAAWQFAYLLGAIGDGSGAEVAAGFVRACALGFPPAYYSLGLRFALGSGIPRDGAFARALLRRAADAGHPDAQVAADELVPEGEYGTGCQRWYDALKRNLDAVRPVLAQLSATQTSGNARRNPLLDRLEQHFVSIGHQAIRIDGTGRLCVDESDGPVLRAAAADWQWLSQMPRVGVSHGFATREECAHMIGKAEGGAMRPASSYRRGNSANEDAEVESFSGKGCPFGPMNTDMVMRVLERRIAGMTKWNMERLEPCSVVSYVPGEEYRPHVDYFTPQQIELNRARRSDHGGQRIATFLLYLRAPDGGGETFYHVPSLSVAGECGVGVIHYNAAPDGSPDRQSLHSGRPITRGEKWLWRSALREHSLYSDAP